MESSAPRVFESFRSRAGRSRRQGRTQSLQSSHRLRLYRRKACHDASRQQTMRYRAHVPPDTAAAVWYLKNRRTDRWRDSFRHEHIASPYDAIEDATELRALLTEQAQALGLIASPIIDVTPKAPSSAHAE